MHAFRSPKIQGKVFIAQFAKYQSAGSVLILIRYLCGFLVTSIPFYLFFYYFYIKYV